jgi:D-3-phosphoglycerate dehydrogenase
MIAAIICGRLDDKTFPGRNTFPLIGRPMMVYPLLAAVNAKHVQHVFVSTDAPEMARVARHHNVEVIQRPPEISARATTLEEVLQHGYAFITKRLKNPLEALVVLLCNGPTVTNGLIDQGVEILVNDESLDAVMSVSRHNEFDPRYALQLVVGGLLEPVLPSARTSTKLRPAKAGSAERSVETSLMPDRDVYFPDSLLWVLRPPRYFDGKASTVHPNWVVNSATQRVHALVHDGYGDVDYVWQIPAIEEWLRRHGFSEETTPYDRLEAPPRIPKWARSGSSSRPGETSTVAERRVLITTVPFATYNRQPLDLLEANKIEYLINPIGRKLKEAELAEMIGDFGVLIAGTEAITARVIDRAPHLRLIARVGIGLDNVDLVAARQRGIVVSYTPDAPSTAVAELTIGLMFSLLRQIPQADRGMRNGVWHRFMGRRLAEVTVGVIGVGRIGRRIIRHLKGFGSKILANDLTPAVAYGNEPCLRWVDKETIYREADVITLHVPLTPLTHRMITAHEIEMMKPEALLINTSRGNIIDEADLAAALRAGRIGGAAIDVFGQEPYSGELATLDKCVMTSHMGSMSRDCRVRMELEATQEALRFLNGEPLRQVVPEEEYMLREQSNSKLEAVLA